jgi:hypothetical protein
MDEIRRLVTELSQANLRAAVKGMSYIDRERSAVAAAVAECRLIQAIRKEVGKFAS